MNNDEYRIDDTRFNWRCTSEERQELKIYSALEHDNMNAILSRAWRYYVEEVLQKKYKLEKLP